MSRLILASASHARASLLRAAGVGVAIQPAEVDEDAIKHDLKQQNLKPAGIAMALAKAKSCAVSKIETDALVIGADQILVHDDHLYDKPGSMHEARQHLVTLRGTTHRLISAVSVSENGAELWSATSHADLTMRNFSDAFLKSYLTSFGEKALTSVGAYHLEGLGAQLFSKIEGDYFTILGLPLLELLDFLRSREILTT